MRTSLLIVIVAMMVSSALAQTTPPPTTQLAETKEQRDARMKWWRDARFGMFIHWGLYAIPAGEWQGEEVKGVGEWIMNSAHVPVERYAELTGKFEPKKFDAHAWAKVMKDAGMKYVVITSKHHDGFAIFDSKVSEYDVMATPFKRDILKELSDACRNEGIVFCWYHSIMDWHHPDAQAPFYPEYNKGGKEPNPNWARYREEFLKPQLKELLTNYGDIGVAWFDGEWVKEWTEPQGKDLYHFVKQLQPNIIINNRVGKGRKGMQGMSKDPNAAGDFGTPEQEVPAGGFPEGVDWESCMTMNDTWGFKKNDHNWKSEEKLIHTLIETSSKGGNFLLNVGPTAEGEIPQASIERLAAMGKWMKVNGESIYGTTASPFSAEQPWGRATQKPGKLYLHIMKWPAGGKLVVPLTNKPTKAYLLAKPDAALETASAASGLTITGPEEAPDKVATVVVLEIEGPANVIQPTTAPTATPAK